jgi:hypothetical protein
MNKKVVLLLALILISVVVVAQNQLSASSPSRDIPTPLNPAFVKQIEDCGKLDLIDRSSVNYNPNALVDGSLSECEQ